MAHRPRVKEPTLKARREENTTAGAPNLFTATAVFEVVGPDWAENQPNKTVVRLALDAAKLIKDGNGAAALPLIDRAIRLRSNDAALHCLRAVALFSETDQADEVIKACRRSINLNPNIGEAYLYLGGALAWKGRGFKAMLEAFDRAAELGVLHPLVHSIRGDCLSGLNRLDEAVEAYGLALENPEVIAHSKFLLTVSQRLLEVSRRLAEQANDKALAAAKINTSVGKSNKSKYTEDMDEAAKARLAPAAHDYGLSIKEADKALAMAAQAKVAARSVTRRTKAKPHAESSSPATAPDFAASAHDTTTPARKARRGSSVLVERTTLVERTLLPLPNGLEWPKEHFEGSREFRKHEKNGGGIVNHLDRVWRPLIAAGMVDMPLLRTFYPSTAAAIDNYKGSGPATRKTGIRRNLPHDLDVPLVKAGSGRRPARGLGHATAA